MTASNISICFGPALSRPFVLETPIKGMETNSKKCRFMEFCIDHCDEIFPQTSSLPNSPPLSKKTSESTSPYSNQASSDVRLLSKTKSFPQPTKDHKANIQKEKIQEFYQL